MVTEEQENTSFSRKKRNLTIKNSNGVCGGEQKYGD